jgi:hypothetical protein
LEQFDPAVVEMFAEAVPLEKLKGTEGLEGLEWPLPVVG